MTIVGTRPELIKMCCVIDRLDRETDHVLVHTGQNYDYELNQVFFDDLGIRKPDHFLSAAGDSAAETIANTIIKTDKVLEHEKPNAVLIYGDTNSGLAVIAAKRRKVPVFHMEAGNRCFDQRVPEELNRKVIDHLADVNMVLTEHARRYLLAEGLPAERIFKTGSHLEEVLERFRPKIEASNVLNELGLEEGEYFLVSSHREENVDDPDPMPGPHRNPQRACELLSRADHLLHASSHPAPFRRDQGPARRSAGSVLATLRLLRLHPPAERREMRAVRQRHHNRGSGLARSASRQSPRRARATRRDGRGCSHNVRHPA